MLEGRSAVVTGGGRGIGAAVVEELARSGARVVAAARTTSEVEEVADRLRGQGHEVWGLPCDVTDEAAIIELVRGARERLGKVDILVNNAGIASSSPVKRLKTEEWERMFAVNVRGVFLATRAFLPEMVERGWGRIVNVASIAGLAGAAYISHYAATKHAVVGFTRSVAAEVATQGVTVNAVCPGYVDTPMTERSVAQIVQVAGLSPEEARQRLEAMSPQRRLMEPEEIAFWVRCLCDPRGRGVNGETLVINGGALPG